MMGHPGFSALEYAGKSSKKNENEKRENENPKNDDKTTDFGIFKKKFGKEPPSMPPSMPAPDPREASFADTESSAQSQFADDPVFNQRRGGTFFDPTPRDFDHSWGRRADNPFSPHESYELTPMGATTPGLTVERSNTGESSTGEGHDSQRHYKRRSIGSISWLSRSSSIKGKAPALTRSATSAHLPVERSDAQHRHVMPRSTASARPRSTTVADFARLARLPVVQDFFRNRTNSDVKVDTDHDEVESNTLENAGNAALPTTPRHHRAGEGEDDFAAACEANVEDDRTRLLRAPPILSNEALGKTQPKDELQMFLRNTSPSDMDKKSKKGKKGFSFGGKKQSKSSSDTRFDSSESSPTKNKLVKAPPPVFLPTGPKERSQSKGKKRTESEPEAQEDSPTLPRDLGLEIWKTVTITQTEERVNPATDTTPYGITTTITGGDQARADLEGGPSNNNPLLAREEQTTQRKLKDLDAARKKKNKKRGGKDKSNGAAEFPESSTLASSASGAGSGPTSTTGSIPGGSIPGGTTVGTGLSDAVARMETLVHNLTIELAEYIGLETAGRDLNPEAVLIVARRRRLGRE